MAGGNCTASPLFFTSAAAIQDLPMLPPTPCCSPTWVTFEQCCSFHICIWQQLGWSMAGFKALRLQPRLLPVGVAHTNPRYPLCTVSVLGTLDIGSFLFISMFSVSQTNRNYSLYSVKLFLHPWERKPASIRIPHPWLHTLCLAYYCL